MKLFPNPKTLLFWLRQRYEGDRRDRFGKMSNLEILAGAGCLMAIIAFGPMCLANGNFGLLILIVAPFAMFWGWRLLGFLRARFFGPARKFRQRRRRRR